MTFDQPLLPATLIRRYKRFLADVRLEDGRQLTVHCANSGSMAGCDTPDSAVLLSDSHNPKRKLRYTWELVRVGETWVGINTMRPNQVVEEGIVGGKIGTLAGYPTLRREVPYGDRSRVDLLLEDGDHRCFVEVKNVTLAEGHVALFPDAVTRRGLTHLRELGLRVTAGDRAAMVYLVNREDCTSFRAATHIDREYGHGLQMAAEAGVEVLVYGARVTPAGISLHRRIDDVVLG
jgi:sugar fermentation stimulation protein A